MITYKSICDKLGFDPVVDGKMMEPSKHEDDSRESPFSKLSLEEQEFLADHLLKDKHNIKQYTIQ